MVDCYHLDALDTSRGTFGMMRDSKVTTPTVQKKVDHRQLHGIQQFLQQQAGRNDVGG